MTDILTQIEKAVFIPCGLSITQTERDAECEEYHGFNLLCGQHRIKFRQAKLTPKKVGNFVALWKRNAASGETEPFHLSDPFDFYVIAVHDEAQEGFFCFPKAALAQNGVLTFGEKEGKRGFRLYPAWVAPPNRQAQRTQQWQAPYFFGREEWTCNARIRRILAEK